MMSVKLDPYMINVQECIRRAEGGRLKSSSTQLLTEGNEAKEEGTRKE
jgi:hypothetical protein